MIRRCWIGVVLALSVPALTAAQAPDPATMAQEYGKAASANAALMRQYSWKMRVEMTRKGEVKPAKMYHVRFTSDGTLQKTPLTSDKPQKKTRGIRGRIKKKKIKEAKEWAAEVAEVVKKYSAPSPGTMLDFYNKAKVNLVDDGSVKMTAAGFLQPGDRATFWLDRQTKAPIRFSFITRLAEDSVRGQIEFGQLADGLRYADRTAIQVPTREVSAIVETFDYAKQ